MTLHKTLPIRIIEDTNGCSFSQTGVPSVSCGNLPSASVNNSSDTRSLSACLPPSQRPAAEVMSPDPRGHSRTPRALRGKTFGDRLLGLGPCWLRPGPSVAHTSSYLPRQAHSSSYIWHAHTSSYLPRQAHTLRSHTKSGHLSAISITCLVLILCRGCLVSQSKTGPWDRPSALGMGLP